MGSPGSQIIEVEDMHGEISEVTVLEQWAEREAAKPDHEAHTAAIARANRAELVAILGETYEEPVHFATGIAADWHTCSITGGELGKFNHIPHYTWKPFSDDGTIESVVDRITDGTLDDEHSAFVAKISSILEMIRDTDMGALVACHTSPRRPPILLDGNHRATAAHLASRRGIHVELQVNLGHRAPIERLPLRNPE